MSNQIVIGIAGEKGAGKDTAAKVLVDDYGFKRAAFADPLKEICAEAFELDLYDLHDPVKKELPFHSAYSPSAEAIKRFLNIINGYLEIDDEEREAVTASFKGKSFASPRELLQYVGTEVVRKNVVDSFWVDVFAKGIKKYNKVVITDMRFANERAFIKNELKGSLVRIKRGNGSGTGHASETSFGSDNEYDRVVRNDGDIPTLHSRIEEYYLTKVKGYVKYAGGLFLYFFACGYITAMVLNSLIGGTQ